MGGQRVLRAATAAPTRWSTHMSSNTSLAVSPRVAGEMLGYGKTYIAKLIRNRELETFVDGGARRVLTASIHDYIARKVEATSAPASRGPSRLRNTPAKTSA
jgi:hypothetical protein